MSEKSFDFRQFDGLLRTFFSSRQMDAWRDDRRQWLAQINAGGHVRLTRAIDKFGSSPLGFVLYAALLKCGAKPQTQVSYFRSHVAVGTVFEMFVCSDIRQALSAYGDRAVALYADAVKAVESTDAAISLRRSESVAMGYYFGGLGEPISVDSSQAQMSNLLDSGLDQAKVEAIIKRISRSSSNPRSDLYTAAWICTRHLPILMLSKGHAYADVFECVRMRLKGTLSFLGAKMSSEQVDAVMRTHKAYVLANQSERWEEFGLKLEDFFGVSLLSKQLENLNQDQKSIVWLFQECAINRNESFVASGCIRHLKKHFSNVFDPALVLFDGSRAKEWNRHVDFEAAGPYLKQLYLANIWHPLATDPKLARTGDSEMALKMVVDYLNQGAKWRRAQAQEMVSQKIVSMDDALPLVEGKQAYGRLAEMFSPTHEQFMKIPQKYRTFFMGRQFGL